MKDTVEKLLTIISGCEEEELDKQRKAINGMILCLTCRQPMQFHQAEDGRRQWGRSSDCTCSLTSEQFQELGDEVVGFNPNVVRHCKSMRALVQLCGTVIEVGQDYKQLKGITTSESQAWSEGRADMALSALRLLAGAYDVPYETDPDSFERMKTALRNSPGASR